MQALAAIATLGGTEIRNTRKVLRLTKESVDVADTPAIDGIYGNEYARDGVKPLVLVEAGDSLLSGRGSSSPENSAAVQVAVGLAHEKQRQVLLIHVARTAHRHIHLESQRNDAEKQLDAAKEELKKKKSKSDDGLKFDIDDLTPDLVFVTMGAAEVTGGSIWRQAKTDYRDFISKVTRTGARVIWGTVPPIDAPVPVAESLLASGAMARKGAKWDGNTMTLLGDIAREGYAVTPVSFQELMDDYRDQPEYFANLDPDHPVPDPFHPGDLGQRVAAERVLPFLVKALDTRGDPHPKQKDFTRRGIPVPGRVRPTPQRGRPDRGMTT